VRITNVLNALILLTAAILVFVLGKSLNIPKVLSAVYVIGFSLLLLLFEMRLNRCKLVILSNFGFMFNVTGRCMFFFFVGTLCFGLDIFGIIAGIITCCNLIFNCVIMCQNKAFKDHLIAENRAAKEALTAHHAEQYATKTGAATPQKKTKPTAVAKPVQARDVEMQVAMPTPAANDAGVASADGWVRYLDESTHPYYSHHEASGQTRWEEE
jgi:hypothetical protein